MKEWAESADCAVGVDLGGTKIAAALVSSSGEILARAARRTPAEDGPEAILDAVSQCVADLDAPGGVSLGIGSAGVIDPASGRVLSATSALRGWGGTDLVGGLAERTGATTIAAVNDVHAHALGEAWIGSAAGASSSLHAAFGTGVGGSFLLEGRPVTGARHVGGHLGHVPSAAAGCLSCTCGRIGHLEAIASGPAIHAQFLRQGGDSSVEDTRQVFALAQSGEPAERALASEVIVAAARAAGSALGGLANTLDPEIVVISGGLASAGPLWWDAFEDAFHAELLTALEGLPLVIAQLGSDAPTIGAARLVLHPNHDGADL